METHEQNRLVNAYIQRYSRYDPAIGRHEVRSFWVWQACDWLCVNDPEGLWRLVLEVLARTDSPRVLGALAAGELEDLIEYHGPAFIGRIEQEAARAPRFRRLLCGVWRSSTPEVWARVLAASDSNFNEVPQRAMWICYERRGWDAQGAAAQPDGEAGVSREAHRQPARVVPSPSPSPFRQREGAMHSDSPHHPAWPTSPDP
ncbi:DUF6869 domain-containing protein [Cupriavidus basilensis]|uniref:DUF6869 domain-containing protein n=1 Tax=Cupriavidus basilensis TaxID=68895 RepID=A0A643FWV8_9BURK|nr:hypothetical protein [Cupriavidus basilensis]QOT78808.1 hypothetical protein F7R26_028850 [Cupriavidus basilensis]